MEFTGKVVVVTGSSTGIGQAVAMRFARAGAAVVVNCRSNVAGGQETVERITASGGQALLAQADVSDPEAASKLFGAAVGRFGTVDVLVNNAGAARGVPFMQSTPEQWRQQFDANFFGAVWCSQEAARIMQQHGGGSIINTTSVRGIEHTGREGLMAYSAAKAAMISFTKTLAKDLAPSITVNAVAPGFVMTRNYDHMSPDQTSSFINQTQLKRFIEVDEIADAYLYLAGTPVVTGHVLVVDGGFILK